MTAPLDFTTPAQALNAMVDAGAVFAVHRRNDGLDATFTYGAGDGGDLERCRAIRAHVKSKPPQFSAAFCAAIQSQAVEDVSTSSTRVRSEVGAETPPSTASRRIVGGAGAPRTRPDAEGVVETTPVVAGRGAA